MNVEKCEACWISRSKGDTEQPVMCKLISITNNTIKILGTHFNYNKLLEKKMNFYNLVTDCCTISNIWKQRWLSLAGKYKYLNLLLLQNLSTLQQWKVYPKMCWMNCNECNKNSSGRANGLKLSTPPRVD